MWRVRIPIGVAGLFGSATGSAAGFVPGAPLEWLVDPKLAIVVAVGVPFGIAARSAYLVEKRVRWPNIKRDLIVSVLIAGGNFILALSLATQMGLGYLPSMALSFAICATGIKTTFDLAKKWVERLKPIDQQQGERAQQAQIIKSAVQQALEEDRAEREAQEARRRYLDHQTDEAPPAP